MLRTPFMRPYNPYATGARPVAALASMGACRALCGCSGSVERVVVGDEVRNRGG